LIVNQKKNASFRSTLEYVLGKEKSTIIDTNMGGETPRQLAAEFAAARRHRPNLKRACGHIIISIPHRSADHLKGEYHEHLEDEQYVALAHRWLIGMEFLGEGLSCSQYLIARHHDTLHEHIHIIASRIRMDGSVVSDSWDYRRSEVIVRQLEKEFSLEATPCSNERVAEKVEGKGISTTVADRRAPTRKQKHHDSGFPTVKQRLADLIDEACSDSPTVTQLIGRLQHKGVIVHPQFSTRGLFKDAIAFELDGVKVAGNKIGSAYSFPGLVSKRGVSYDPDRDLKALQAAAVGELVSLTFPPLETNQPPSTSISSLMETDQPSTQNQKEEPTPIADCTQIAAYQKLFDLLFNQRELSVTEASATIEPDEPDNLTPSSLSHQKLPELISTNRLHIELATQMYPDIALVWNQYRTHSTEVEPGRWVLDGNFHELVYDSKTEELFLNHHQRGLLARYKGGKVLFAQGITPEDVENFSQIAALSQQPPQQLPQQKPQIER
jgi:hypothetical protein